MEIIRSILSVVEWHGYETTIGDNIRNKLFIARQDGLLGIVDDSKKIVVDFKYDSITPLGGGIWLDRKNDKYGIIRIDVNDNLLSVGYMVSCVYDYIYRKDLGAIYLCTYDEDAGRDYNSIYLPGIDKIYECVAYDCISSLWGYINGVIDNEEKAIFINLRTGSEINFDLDFFPAGDVAYDGYNTQFITMCSVHSDHSKLVRLRSVGKSDNIIIAGNYDGLPTFVYSPEKERMEDPIPLAFIGKRKGKYVWINRDLEEYPMPLEGLNIAIDFTGSYKGTKVNQRLLTMFGDDMGVSENFE